MADKLQAKRMVFMIDTNNGTDYDKVVCLTNVSYERSANVIDASSKCGSEKLNGTKERTIQIEGLVEINSSAGSVSEDVLDDVFEEDTKIGWAFGPESPESGEPIYSGVNATISNVTLGAPNEGACTFSATVQLNERPTKVITS